MKTISPLEMRLVSIFHFTKSVEGSRVGLAALDVLERQAKTVDESDTIKDCMDFLFIRGNMRIVENRV